MAVRPYWKGYLKLSLVTCPVQMMPATSESEKVRFHTLNRETHNRVVSHYVDAVTARRCRTKTRSKAISGARTTTSSSRTRSWRMSLWTAPRPSISMSSLRAISSSGSGSTRPIISPRTIRSDKRPSRSSEMLWPPRTWWVSPVLSSRAGNARSCLSHVEGHRPVDPALRR